jgi:hypothetical protein
MNEIDSIKQSIVRFLSISGFIVLIAYLIFGKKIFILTYAPSQFFQSGITIGLAYTSFYNNKVRQGIASLILWFILLYSISSSRHWWIVVLCLTYISMISLGVYYSIKINHKPFITNEFFRIATFTVLLGISNALIIVVLNLITFWRIKYNLPQIPESMLFNLRYGAMLGCFAGVSIELFDRFIYPKMFIEKVAS